MRKYTKQYEIEQLGKAERSISRALDQIASVSGNGILELMIKMEETRNTLIDMKFAAEITDEKDYR